jgi:trans-aconitate methyltransferase
MTATNLLTDNPALYEARFPDPDHLAARWTEDCLRRNVAGRRVLDLGCGTGRDAAHLHRAGRTVTGADLSEAMLAHARTHHPGPTYVHADLHGLTWAGKCSTPWCAWTAPCCTAIPTNSSTPS